MDKQELVTKLTEYVGKPVHISSVVSGHRVGGEGILKDVIIDSDQNGCVKVEFQDGRMFGVRDQEFELKKVARAEAEDDEEKTLNVDEGDGEETDAAKEKREAKEAGEDPTDTGRKAKKPTETAKVKIKKTK